MAAIISVLFVSLFLAIADPAISAIVTVIEEQDHIWLGDSWGVNWTSSKFDLPNINMNEQVKVYVRHYSVYPDIPRDTVWINGIWLFNLGQSSTGGWGDEIFWFDPNVSFLEHDNTITIYSDGLYDYNEPSDPGHDDFWIGYLTIKYATNPVPIPGAVWLLGSGLIGLIGVRKKLKK